MKALREDPHFACQRVIVGCGEPAVDEIREQVEQRLPDHVRRAPAGPGREPLVPPADDEAIVGDEHAAVIELFEPLARRGAKRIELLLLRHHGLL